MDFESKDVETRLGAVRPVAEAWSGTRNGPSGPVPPGEKFRNRQLVAAMQRLRDGAGINWVLAAGESARGDAEFTEILEKCRTLPFATASRLSTRILKKWSETVSAVKEGDPAQLMSRIGRLPSGMQNMAALTFFYDWMKPETHSDWETVADWTLSRLSDPSLFLSYNFPAGAFGHEPERWCRWLEKHPETFKGEIQPLIYIFDTLARQGDGSLAPDATSLIRPFFRVWFKSNPESVHAALHSTTPFWKADLNGILQTLASESP
jgi:hypothetical protein